MRVCLHWVGSESLSVPSFKDDRGLTPALLRPTLEVLLLLLLAALLGAGHCPKDVEMGVSAGNEVPPCRTCGFAVCSARASQSQNSSCRIGVSQPD